MTRAKDIPTLVSQVVEDHRQYTEAVRVEQEQEAALLGEVLEEVRPALPALCSRLDASDGVKMANQGIKLYKAGIAGDTLCLLETGEFARLSQSPPWLHCLGKEPIEVIRAGWNAAKIIQALVESLEAQVYGSKVSVTANIWERSSRLRALHYLLKGTGKG